MFSGLSFASDLGGGREDECTCLVLVELFSFRQEFFRHNTYTLVVNYPVTTFFP